MRVLDVCSGISAPSVAWHTLGWETAAFAEIDRFASAVLAHHYPGVPNLGDITRHEEWPEIGTIDVLVGGTPCQSYSIAGQRGGVADPRGNLALVFCSLAAKYRPEWVIWENVPGVFSTSGGRDFAAFLDEMAKCGYYGAWRVLDAQYFGLAQRRKRVFAVFCLGDWRPAAQILFEPASLRRDTPPRRAAPQDIAHPIAARSQSNVAADLIPLAYGGNRTSGPLEVATAVNAHGGPHGRLDFASETFVVHAVGRNQWQENVVCVTGQITHTLTAGLREDGTGRGVPIVAFHDSHWRGTAGEIAPTLKSDAAGKIAMANGSTVRRLTPRECERLQGFPDDYTLIPYRGRPAADRRHRTHAVLTHPED